ncbi:hypothetical protein [Pseudomonas asplenii]|uniref:hypothetical protein n=1 Tax=Pseudomonas asplenii TaxID=53407 RepID=UPI001EFB4244|nr:hypothetical protein [Pseudomonas fuscovaginae]
MNHLTIVQHTSKYITQPYPTFAIDGLPFEVWLPQQDPGTEMNLVSAHWGLDNDWDVELIWDRSYSTAPGWKTLVPLLVCSEDLDLNCAVVAVEQVADQERIHWQRFGVMRGWIHDADPEVDWFEGVAPVSFQRAEFMSALDSFRQLIGLKLDWYD